MAEVAEFTVRTDFPEAVEASFTEELVVFRGGLGKDDLATLNPHLGNFQSERVTNPFLGTAARIINQSIPGIKEARHISRDWMRSNLGRLSVIISYGLILRPDLYRNGGIEQHIDNFLIVTAASINLTNDSSKPTVFYAERVAAANAPYKDISKAHKDWESTNTTPAVSVELDPGDIAIISRGVVHMVDASYERQALMLGTRCIAAT